MAGAVNRKSWPNLLSAGRIALMPALLTAALLGSRAWFVALLVSSLATDLLDGFLARRFDAFSDFGRKLDSAADYLTLTTGLAGIALLWPEIMRRELPWVISGLVVFFAVMVLGVLRFGVAPCHHTWAAKVGTAGCALALMPLLAGWSATPFHVMMVVQILAGFEGAAIILLVPETRGEVATLWHAWRGRRQRSQ
jgi:phosphatidylglycerophosphate synthase